MVEFMDLPVEVLTVIFSLLDTSTKVKLCRMSRWFDSIICTRQAVSCLKFNTVINFACNDLAFMTTNKIRCQNIISLNIDGWYWTPRKDLYMIVKSLTNLKELFVIDTKLNIHDIHILLGILKKLEFVSFTHEDGKIKPETLQKYKTRFSLLGKVLIDYRGSEELADLSIFLSGFPNYCLTPSMINRNYKLLHRDYIYIRLRHTPFLNQLFRGELPGYYDLLHKFVPGIEQTEWTTRSSYRLVFPYEILRLMQHKRITVNNITKLSLFDLRYNFKNVQLPETCKNIRELFINDYQLFDVPNAPRPIKNKGTKKQRLGVIENADDEENQPIRTLVAACPNLEVLCIKRREPSENTTLVWYPNCLKSISMWKNLRMLTLYNVESMTGAFLEDIALNCPEITHLTLVLNGLPGTVCIFGNEVCSALPYWTKLQYINIQEVEPRIHTLLHALAHSVSLRVIIIGVNHKLCIKKNATVRYHDLKFLISNLADLIFFQIINPEFSKHYAYNLETTLKKDFGKTRKRLKIFMEDCKCESSPNRLKPFFLNALDLTDWTYWMK